MISYEQVLKANPYHGEGGRFTTQGKATFVSTGGKFAKSNARDKEQFQKEKFSTDEYDIKHGAMDVGAELATPAHYGPGTVKIKRHTGDLTLTTPFYGDKKDLKDRMDQSKKEWSEGGAYQKYFKNKGIQVEAGDVTFEGDGTRMGEVGSKTAPYKLVQQLHVKSAVPPNDRLTKKSQKDWGVELGVVRRR